MIEGTIEENNEEFVRIKTLSGASRIFYHDKIASVGTIQKDEPMTKEEKKQFTKEQKDLNAQAKREKPKLSHEQYVELWKKQFPDFKRVTGFYAELSLTLGTRMQDIYEGYHKWNGYSFDYHGDYYHDWKFNWSIDALIGYRFSPYLTLGIGGGIGQSWLIYPISAKTTFLHCGVGSLFFESKFVLDVNDGHGICYGGKFDFGYSFPVGKWFHLNTSFQYTLLGGGYEKDYTIVDGQTYIGYLSPTGKDFINRRSGPLHCFCFRFGFEF